MANTIKIKRSAVQGKAPTTNDLDLGELAVNTYDGKLYLKKDNGTASIVEVGAAGGSIALNDLSDVTITSPSNGQVVKYNGTAWVNGTDNSFSGSYTDLTNKPTIPAALDDLSDVAITSAVKGHLVVHNGTQFVNSNTVEASAAGVKPLIVKAAASQTANLVELQDSAGSALVTFSSSGVLQLKSLYPTGAFGSTQNVCIGPSAGNAINATEVVAIGQNAMQYNTSGQNVAIGHSALKGTSGSSASDMNVCVGAYSGASVTTSPHNVLIGYYAGSTLTSGFGANVIIGRHAPGNTDIPATAAGVVCIGANASVTGGSCVNIAGGATGSGSINIKGASAGTNAISLGASAAAANDCLDVRFGSAQRITGTSAGLIGVNTATALGQVHVSSTGSTDNKIASHFSASAQGNNWKFQKSRNATNGSHTIVSAGDSIAALMFYGSNGTSFVQGAEIGVEVETGVGTGNDMPSRIVFKTSADGSATPTERMRIDSAGRVGIGTAAPSSNYQVDITGGGFISRGRSLVNADQANNYAMSVINSNTGGFAYGLIVDSARDSYALAVRDNSNTYRHIFNADGSLNIGGSANALNVNASGQLGIGATPSYQLHLSTDSAAKPTTNTWTIASDSRLKTNIRPYTKGLAEVDSIQPIEYDYNGLGGLPAGSGGISIIAQELEPVFPECVGRYSAKLYPEDEEETVLLNYNGHAITFALINAVKELKARVEELERRLAAGGIA